MLAIVLGAVLVGAAGFFMGDIVDHSMIGALMGVVIGGLVPAALVLCIPLVGLYFMWFYGTYRRRAHQVVELPEMTAHFRSRVYNGGGRLLQD